jgi:hypothetical protein
MMRKMFSSRRLKMIGVFVFWGILTIAATVQAQEPVIITLDVHKEAQVTRIDYYLKESEGVKNCWVDVYVKNISQSDKGFEVIVEANDEGGGATMIGENKGPQGFLEPNKIQNVSIMTPSEQLPGKLAIMINR